MEKVELFFAADYVLVHLCKMFECVYDFADVILDQAFGAEFGGSKQGSLAHAYCDFMEAEGLTQAALAERMEGAAGGTFHLVSGQPLPVERFTGTIAAYPHFHEPELVPPEAFDPAMLPALERRLFRRVAGLYASYFQRNPHFDDSAFRAVTGLHCPHTSEAYIRRLIDHCIAVGFLPASARADNVVPA